MKNTIVLLLFLLSGFISSAQSMSNVVQYNSGTIITYRSDGSEISRMAFDVQQARLAGFTKKFLVVVSGSSVSSYDENFNRLGFFNIVVGQYVKYVNSGAIGVKSEGAFYGDDSGGAVIWYDKAGLPLGVTFD
jgi:hypothetical protein